MDKPIELNDVVACTYDENEDNNAYEPLDTEKRENDNSKIRTTATNRVSQRTVDYENTKINSFSESVGSSTKHDAVSSLAKTCDAAILKNLEEQASSLKRLQIVCAVLSLLLVACSVTLGVVVQSAMSRIGNMENISDGLDRKHGYAKIATNTSIEENINRISRLDVELAVLNDSLQKCSDRLVHLESEQTSTHEIISILQSRTMELESAKLTDFATIQNHASRITELEGNPIVGFTVRNKRDIVKGALRFHYIVTTVGEGYNHSTGVFTSPTPGLYLVSVTLQLENDGNMICQIYQNARSTGLEIDIKGTTQEPGSHTVVLLLNKGDTVYIGGCNDADLIGDETSFTVALLHANN